MNALAVRLGTLLEPDDRLVLGLLFGSQASARTNAESDVDVALLGREPLDAALKIELIRRIGQASGRQVDLIDLYHTPEPVTGEALQGVRLFGADHEFAELLIRHLDNVEDFIPLQRRIFDERRDKWLR